MEFLNVSINSRIHNSDEDKEEDVHLNITGIKINKSFSSQIMSEEYEDQLQEKDEIIDDLRYELDRKNRRQFEDTRKYQSLNNNFNNYKNKTNIKVRNLENQVKKYYNNYLDLQDRKEDLEDENYDLNNEIRRLKRKESDYNYRVNQLSQEKNILNNHLNEYKMANELNTNSLLQLNQEYNTLLKEKQILQEMNQLQNSQIIRLKQELSETKEKNQELSRTFIQPVQKYYQTGNIFQSYNENNYYSYQNNPSEINVIFQSPDQKIKKVIKCYENESFMAVEERLIQSIPSLINKKIAFVANASKVVKTKTIKENNITDGLKVLAIVNDNNNLYFNNNSNNIFNDGNNSTYINENQNSNYIYISPISTTTIEPNNINQTSYVNSFTDNIFPTTTTTRSTTSYTAQPMSVVPEITLNPTPINNNSYITTEAQPMSVVPEITLNSTPINNNFYTTTEAQTMSVVPEITLNSTNSYATTEAQPMSVVPEITLNSTPISVVPSIIMSSNSINNNYYTDIDT